MKYLAAIVAGLLHPILVRYGWSIYESFSRVPGPSTAIGGPGSLSARDRETLRHLQGWNVR